MMNGVLLCKICHRLAEDKQERFLKWLRYEHWDRWVWQHENKSPKTMGALAYKGELAAQVVPISKAVEIADSGDRVTVEGQVIGKTSKQGNLTIFEIEDDTGSVLVAVTERQMRELREPGMSPRGEWVRVSGKWTHGYMKTEREGIRAQRVERIDR